MLWESPDTPSFGHGLRISVPVAPDHILMVVGYTISVNRYYYSAEQVGTLPRVPSRRARLYRLPMSIPGWQVRQ